MTPYDLGYAAAALFVANTKQAATPELSYSLKGRLELSKSGWLILAVPNDLGVGAFKALNEPGAEMPYSSALGRYNAHISVMRPDEVEQIGADKINERGKQFSFTLGPVRMVEPSGWPEMDRVWYIEIRSPELEKIRKSYGLPALPKDGEYKFHITFAVRRRKVLRPGDIVKGMSKASIVHRPEEYAEKLAEHRAIYFPLKVTKTITVTESLCPHCEKPIREKSVYVDGEGYEYHRPCKDKGPIGRPFTAAQMRQMGHPDAKDEPPESQTKKADDTAAMKRELDSLPADGFMGAWFEPMTRRMFLNFGDWAAHEDIEAYKDAFSQYSNDIEIGDEAGGPGPGNWVKLALASGVEIKESPIDGKGLFATKNYEPGDVIVAKAMAKMKGEDGLTRYEQSDEARFTNHANDNNIALRHGDGYVVMVADRPIAAGEELVGNYRDVTAILGPGFYFTYQGKKYGGESSSGSDGRAWDGDSAAETQAPKSQLRRLLGAMFNTTYDPSADMERAGFDFISAGRPGNVEDGGLSLPPGRSGEDLGRPGDLHSEAVAAFAREQHSIPDQTKNAVHREAEYDPYSLAGSLCGVLWHDQQPSGLPGDTAHRGINKRDDATRPDSENDRLAQEVANSLAGIVRVATRRKQAGHPCADTPGATGAAHYLPHIAVKNQTVFQRSDVHRSGHGSAPSADVRWRDPTGGPHSLAKQATGKGEYARPQRSGNNNAVSAVALSQLHSVRHGDAAESGTGGCGTGSVKAGHTSGATGANECGSQPMWGNTVTNGANNAATGGVRRVASDDTTTRLLLKAAEVYCADPKNIQSTKEANGLSAAQQVAVARRKTQEPASASQADAGNYRKGKVRLHGLTISIENGKGSTRSGTSPTGKKWSTTMKHDYGYINRTEGKDGDHLDVFLGPNPEAELVFVVNQVDPSTGKFDEHKCMLGFLTEEDARQGYLANYEDGWQGLSSIKAMTMTDFKEWINGDTTKQADFTEKLDDLIMRRDPEGISTQDWDVAMRATPFTYDVQQGPIQNIISYVDRLRGSALGRVQQNAQHDRIMNAADPDRAIRQLQMDLAGGDRHGRNEFNTDTTGATATGGEYRNGTGR